MIFNEEELDNFKSELFLKAVAKILSKGGLSTDNRLRIKQLADKFDFKYTEKA